MFVLRLNDMRAANIENLTNVARAETKEVLIKYLEAEKCEMYTTDEGRWSKSYKQGGPLEWYNTPYDLNEVIVNVKTEDDWAHNAREQFRAQVMSLSIIDSMLVKEATIGEKN